MEMIVKLTCEKDITDYLEWVISRKSEIEAFEHKDIFDSGLSYRAANALKAAGFNTLNEVLPLSEAQLRGIDGIGKKMQIEISTKVREVKLCPPNRSPERPPGSAKRSVIAQLMRAFYVDPESDLLRPLRCRPTNLGPSFRRVRVETDQP